jgi:hypothetical protein
MAIFQKNKRCPIKYQAGIKSIELIQARNLLDLSSMTYYLPALDPAKKKTLEKDSGPWKLFSLTIPLVHGYTFQKMPRKKRSSILDHQ